VRKLHEQQPVDVVFAGKQTIDGDTAQVGPGLAIRLGFQLLTYVSKIQRIEPETREIVVHRRAEGGVQVLGSRMPCVITMLEGTNDMRFATMSGMFRAARTAITRWDRTGAGIQEIAKVGLKGSPTIVARVFAPTPKAVKAERVEGVSSRDVADKFVERLFAQHPELQEALLEHLDALERGA
jgi:electron transfer flavoprotein beta subunit